jgi:hypothetical protein
MDIDAFDLLVRHTYALEGDGILIFRMADMLERHVLQVRGSGAGVPNTRAKAQQIVRADFGHELQPQQDARVAQLIAEQLAKVEPSFGYFETLCRAQAAG